MQTLSAADITRLCEWGSDKHDIDRAVALLRLSDPSTPAEKLSLLPVGARDAQLMRLRSRHFGDQFEMTVNCPKCETSLEFEMGMDALLQDSPAATGAPIAFTDGTVEYRLPNSQDMAAISALTDPTIARQALLGRCLRARNHAGESVHPSAISSEVIDQVLERWAKEDPQADITFKLKCPSCSYKWRSVFDILSYFWRELEIYSHRLQDEVHQIATHYGWAEHTILVMTPERRKRYIDLIGS